MIIHLIKIDFELNIYLQYTQYILYNTYMIHSLLDIIPYILVNYSLNFISKVVINMPMLMLNAWLRIIHKFYIRYTKY